jgi:molecular chaperone GrpE
MAKDENAATMMTGVELIYNKFVNILKQNGLQKIETESADFNTDFHEAIAMVPTPDENMKGKVLDCIQAGYTLNDKVIRHAKVAVGE